MINIAAADLVQILELAKRPRRREPSGKSQGPADALRVIYWYNTLRCNIPAATSPYSLGQLVEPEGYTSLGEPGFRTSMHRNKWSKYAIGRQTPHPKLIEKAEIHCHGSRADINHPIWDLLDREFCSIEELHVQTNRFSRELQVEIAIASSQEVVCSPHEMVYQSADLCLADPLDCIGVLLLLLHKARIEKDVLKQEGLVEAIYRALFVHGNELRMRGIARPIFELIRDDHLCKVPLRGLVFSYSGSDYLAVLGILTKELSLSWNGESNLWTSRRLIRDAIFSGYCGEDLAYITWPVPWVNYPKSASKSRIQGSEIRQLTHERVMATLKAGVRTEELPRQLEELRYLL